MKARLVLASVLLATLSAAQAQADQLYSGGGWPAVAADDRARAVGDTVTVLIHEAASASSKLQKNSSRKTEFGGGVSGGSVDESVSLDFGGNYGGKGELVRSEQFVARMSAEVVGLAPNGDFLIEGRQRMLINGETTSIGVRGRIRPQDISASNAILSSRIADAQIDYDGKGFVSRSAKPGIINRILSFLGIG
ncbi:flagellar basal body L-ring protein FlgH [Tsuneonella sp. CC-YZS046]|uniref:flagellar basal body L-ring protein FlgH n=1 Tax=Tsuneonella sp. CC-YZS046 TaxID=3042152 RepID=UPI002D7904AA|nr:flagellar basal body L-ring protein FlgH [Tsuneonella sp. CC-YZS046]WRO65687.1 flagellar basal body L-ring protein FlgH [Tsuneonella sp. CC-YZS046]